MARGHLFLGNQLDAADHDGREHHNGSTAQNGLRHDGDQRAQLGDQAAEDQEHSAGSQCHAVDHLGHGHQTHVLAKRGIGQHAEQCGKGRAETITDDAAGQLLIRGLTVHATLHHARDIAHRLHCGDDEHDQHRQDRTGIKYHLDRHQLGHCEPGSLRHLAPVEHPCLGELYAISSHASGGQHQTHDESSRITGQNADKDSGGAEETGGPVLEEQDDHQHEQCQQQVLHRAEVLGLVATAEGVDTYRNQRKTDGKHHRAGNHRREEPAQRLQEKAQHAFKNTADDGCAHDRAIGQHTAAHRAHNAVEHANKAGTGTHDNRYCAAHGSDGEQLHQRDDTCHEHGALQQGDLQVRKLAACNAAGAGDDQQRGQVAHEHGADVLQAQRNGLPQGHFGFKLISRFFKLDFLQKFHSPQGFKGLCGSDALQKSENIIAKCR